MRIHFLLRISFCSIFLASCVQTDFKDAVESSSLAPPVENMQIEFSSKVEETGLNVTPYKVTINVKTPKDYGLFLAKSTDPMAFYGLNSINPSLPPSTIIPLVPVVSTDFTYEDVSPTLGVVYYYAVLKKVESVVSVSDPNSTAGTQGLPPPSQITIPVTPVDVYNLSPQVISQSGQKSKIRVSFLPKTYPLYLKIFVNDVEASEVTIPPNTNQYELSSVDFQRDYKFRIIRRNGMTDIDSAVTSNVAALWPTLNYGNDITFKVMPKQNIHEYKIEVKDTTSYGAYYRVFTSDDNISFIETSYVSENTPVRAWSSDYAAPTTKYVKVSQYDRNDVLMSTSTVFALSVPRDIYVGSSQILTGTAYQTAGVINVGRLVLDQGQLDLTDRAYTINASSITLESSDILNGQFGLLIMTSDFVSNNSVIQSFSNASVSVYPTHGKSAGDVKIVTSTASGNITIRNKGQKGYVGPTGATGSTPTDMTYGNCAMASVGGGACAYATFGYVGWHWNSPPAGIPSNINNDAGYPNCPAVTHVSGFASGAGHYAGYYPTMQPLAGNIGQAGLTGGNSGASGRATIWASVSSTLNISFDNGSVIGGLGGAGGAGGVGQKIWSGSYNCPWFQGSTGPTGNAGYYGLSGAAGLRCEKYPNDIIQNCY